MKTVQDYEIFLKVFKEKLNNTIEFSENRGDSWEDIKLFAQELLDNIAVFEEEKQE